MIQYQDDNLRIFESALYRTTTTVIQTDDLVLVVDPNWLPEEVYSIREFVETVKKDRPVFLLFTHSDYDHIIGYKAFENCKTIVSKAFTENPNKAKVLQKIKTFDDEYYIKRKYEIAYPAGGFIVEKDGQRLQIGQTTLTFYLAPGHTADGIFTILEPGGIWISGDYLSNVEFPFIYHSCRAYLETLGKVESILQNHEIKWLIPGHGDATSSVSEMKARAIESKDYIQKLGKSALSNKPFDVEDLWKKYDFPVSLEKAHRENMAVMKKELLG